MMAPKSTRDVITWHAYMSGIKAGSVTGMVAGAAVLSANKYWPAFRIRLGVSGKTALALMPAMAVFSFVSENRMLAGARNPQMYLAAMDPNFVELRVPKQTSLKMYQRAANYWYDHPYRMLVTAGVPLVGGIFAYQSMNTSIQRSQQIMHTRIYGQTAVVALLLGSMAFSDYMKKRGRYEEVEADDE
ncbi:Ubiquinone biosynthesis protein COQ7 [Phytophthora cinnamomi]|uniref:Ubiquinone biosynthesis protein COQ7 n=1 Tax=Phytophthora cinnamomi TaxID=4785 RepID=UPI00355A60C4|nr:Ubiquinone biosynthesis protein COQ7 [Phytophthora cinnamomi]